MRWDLRFLGLAEFVSQWSKDPSTKVGACIVDADRRIISTGYNGFARGVVDSPDRLHDRSKKYPLVIHAERNALLFSRRDLTGCTLYTFPFFTCSVCASMAIQCGVSRIVSPIGPLEIEQRWWPETQLAKSIYTEAGVEFILFPMEMLHDAKR